MTRIVLGLWLVVVWVALWGDLSIANVVSGAAVATALLVAFPTGGHRPPAATAWRAIRPVAVVRLVTYFLVKVIASNLALTRMILSSRDRLRTGVVAVALTCESPGIMTIVANLTALTPGVMAVEVERAPARFHVHVLRLDDPDATRADVLELERRVVDAFAGPLSPGGDGG